METPSGQRSSLWGPLPGEGGGQGGGGGRGSFGERWAGLREGGGCCPPSMPAPCLQRGIQPRSAAGGHMACCSSTQPSPKNTLFSPPRRIPSTINKLPKPRAVLFFSRESEQGARVGAEGKEQRGQAPGERGLPHPLKPGTQRGTVQVGSKACEVGPAPSLGRRVPGGAEVVLGGRQARPDGGRCRRGCPGPPGTGGVALPLQPRPAHSSLDPQSSPSCVSWWAFEVCPSCSLEGVSSSAPGTPPSPSLHQALPPECPGTH